MNPIYKFDINRTTVNLFNPKVVFVEKQLDTGTGELTNALAYDSSDFIAVQPNRNYHFLLNDNTVVPSSKVLVCAYKTNKEFISYISYSTLQFSTPANCGFVRFSFYNENYGGYLPAQIGLFRSNISSFSNYITTIAYPVYKDDLTKDFEKESNQEFFRAKLSGKLSFVGPDYDWIVAQAFDFQFVLILSISYDAGETWTEYWRGNFWKTDCDFDDDAKTVTVTPTVMDKYNAVLAGLEKEYNLIELAPEIVPVKADKRPMVQVYVPGQSVIGCFLSGMWWEQECEPIFSETDLVKAGDGELNFAKNKTTRIIELTSGASSDVPTFSKFDNPSDNVYGTYSLNNGYRLEIFDITESPDNPMVRILLTKEGVSYSWLRDMSAVNFGLPIDIELNPMDGAPYTMSLYMHDFNVYARYLLDVDTIIGVPTFAISKDNDIVPNNRNYNRVVRCDSEDIIYFSTEFSSTPTQWGIRQPGEYYMPPASIYGQEFFPVSRSGWGNMSVWFTQSVVYWLWEEAGRAPFTIRHAYPLYSVISVLLAQIAPGITHDGTTDYSQFLYGENLIGITQTLLITPKSNIVSAGYDQPAQKAPITLKNVLDMLRDCFRCYWFIDDQNRFRVEHIQYFRNGGSYSGSPVVGIDLTTQKVSRNGKEWAFARNQYKFDKPEMAARYQFGWMDDVTQLFEGYPIDIVSKYVNPDNIEQIGVSNFTSDIDYILLNPSEISKDGFVLLAAVEANELTEEYTNTFGSTGVITYKREVPNTWLGKLAKINYYLSNGSCKIRIFRQTGQFIESDTMSGSGNITIQVPSDATMFFFINGTEGATITLYSLYAENLGLPYINFNFNETDHILQNAYVAFIYLQRYYAFDMPAPLYSINGEQMVAQGIKKLKTQTLRFPVLNDPDLVQLVKTNLGNGTIEKLSVNLSSRNANVTLKYDTEQ